ncbi:hypothetical protein QF026_000081 [Streptomyces aurantiacus]|nr:hypothetical protein [Streptomyces aurantiacus]MDQ0771615.1 hypothetical protein [Streptomyces aurantiacus]
MKSGPLGTYAAPAIKLRTRTAIVEALTGSLRAAVSASRAPVDAG